MYRTNKDILPQDQKYWNFLKKHIRYRLREASFRRVYTSLIDEKTPYDSKELKNIKASLITFKNARDKDSSILSDPAVGILRTYLDYKMHEGNQPQELFSIEPAFFYNEKGYVENEHFFDFEIIGEKDPALDVQIISRAYKILCDCGLKDEIRLEINNLGGKESRRKIDETLNNFFVGRLRALSMDCKKLFEEEKYFDILCAKDEDCQILAKMAPKFDDIISEESTTYYNTVKEYLNELQIEFTENVFYENRRFNFTGPFFSFYSTADNQLLVEGGRYDNLSKAFGDYDIPICGVKGFMSRIVSKMQSSDLDVPFKDHVQVYVAQLGPKAKKKSLSLLRDLRETGIHTMGSIGKSSISSQMEIARQYNADYCLLLGEQEVIDHKIIIKDLQKGSQEIFNYDEAIPKIIEKIGRGNVIHYRDIED